MSVTEMNRRLKVWQAMSELFLDTEIDVITYKYIASSVTESGYSADEIKSILWNEVFPVLESNLRSVAGVWEGYSPEWLEKHLRMKAFTTPIILPSGVADDISSSWDMVCEYLPSQYA